MTYDPNKELIEIEYKDDNPATSRTINTQFAKPGLITFSFEVKSPEQIKCYMFHLGQMIRFFPSKIDHWLSLLFKMNREDNKGYFQGKHFEAIIKSIQPKFVDKQFNSFAACCL